MYYVLNNNKIVFADSNRQKLVDTLAFTPQYKDSEIKETDREIENFMFVDTPEWVVWKSEQVRAIRNEYLEKYIDPVVSNPLRWADMTDYEKQEYADYRKYLLNYTETEQWYKQNPKTFEEYCAK